MTLQARAILSIGIEEATALGLDGEARGLLMCEHPTGERVTIAGPPGLAEFSRGAGSTVEEELAVYDKDSLAQRVGWPEDWERQDDSTSWMQLGPRGA